MSFDCQNSSKSICRACLRLIKTSRRKIYLFDIFLNNSTNTLNKCLKISDLFQQYTSVAVQRGDCLPKYICTECYRKLEDFHEFSTKCTESNGKLLEKKVIIEEEMAVSRKYNESNRLEQNNIKGLTFDEIFLKEGRIEDEQSEIDTETDVFQTDEDSDFDENDCKNDKEVFHPKSGKPKFKCKFCKASFHLKMQYDAHLREHAGLKPYPCTECDKAFSKVKTLKEHTLGHLMDDDKVPKYVCDLCGKSFFFKYSLRSHMQTRHMNGQRKSKNRAKCGIKAKFAPEKRIQMRLKKPKTTEENTCPICELEHKTKTDLENHLQTHTKEDKFSCKLCEKCFNAQHKLESHINVVHLKRKKYQCSHCNKSYGYSQMLRDHVTTHNTDKKRPKVCGEGLTQFFSMKTRLQNAQAQVK